MKSEPLNIKVILLTLCIGLIYFLLVIYLMNLELVKMTLMGDYSLNYKINLFLALLGGMWSAMTVTGLTTLVLTATLTGLNTSLIIQRVFSLNQSGKLHFIAGGSSLLGVIGSGCAACGLPLVSFLGLTSSLIYLPLRGYEISFIALILLIISIYFMLRTNKTVCELKTNLPLRGRYLKV